MQDCREEGGGLGSVGSARLCSSGSACYAAWFGSSQLVECSSSSYLCVKSLISSSFERLDHHESAMDFLGGTETIESLFSFSFYLWANP